MTDATLVLVGNNKAGTVSTFRLGENLLQPLASTSVGVGCGTFAVDARRDLVYVNVQEPEPAIATLILSRGSGELTEVARRQIADGASYLNLTRGGEVLLGASYSGGWGSAWPVSDGRLGETPSRVENANMHCVVADRSGQFAYFVSLGDDVVAQCSLGADGSLERLPVPTVGLDAGAGPRHLVLSGDEQRAYLLTEFTGEVIRFERDVQSGELTRAESVAAYAVDRGLSVSRYGADPAEEHLIWGADLHVVADERFVVASERTESTLATISLDRDGRLGEVVAITQTEARPRGFCVSPDGAHVVVAGEESGYVSLYRVGPDGALDQLDRALSGEGANWVRFV